MGNKFKLRKGDEVIVLTGKDKGKTGKIVKMLPKQMKAIVSEINKQVAMKEIEEFVDRITNLDSLSEGKD